MSSGSRSEGAPPLLTPGPRAVGSKLEEGLEDVRRDRVSGPYATAKELIADLHKKRARSAGRTKRTKRS